MNAIEALRAIKFDQLSYIQKMVTVDFDSLLQVPTSFHHRNRRQVVREILGRFRMKPDGFPGGFLVKTADGEVYFLYLCRSDQKRGLGSCYWVLSFRIQRDGELMALYREERKMIVNMTVKRVVDFHGHLCPELVIGMKASEYAQELLFPGQQPRGRISAVVENSSSALDALQVLLGVTVGNQCLKILNFGKHNYTFSARETTKCFILRLKTQHYGDECEYAILEEKTRRNLITLDEVVDFQQLLDGRVRKLLGACPKELFEVAETIAMPQTLEASAVYVACFSCGQQMLQERAVAYREKPYCIPCFQRLKGTNESKSLH